MPYVNERWLGGMLTNFETVSGRVRKLAELEAARDSGEFDALPKKEALHAAGASSRSSSATSAASGA